MRRVLLGFIVLLVKSAGVGWRFWRPAVREAVTSVRSAVVSPLTIRFAVVGDSHGTNPVYQQIIENIKGQNFAFLLHLADTSEQGTTEEFRAVKGLESSLPFPVYHTVGSHDIKDDPTRKTFVKTFGHERWYTIDYSQLHLIILDNADRKIGFPAEELDWLEHDLAGHRGSTNIIAYHRPFGLPLASFFGDDETAASAVTNERFSSILQHAKVAQILTAHLHTYLPYNLTGIPAVVTGGGGDPAQLVLGGAKNNYFHYLDITVKGSAVTVSPIPITLDSPTSE